MSRLRVFRFGCAILLAATIPLGFATLACAQDTTSDPPDRVARLAYLSGDVEFSPAGENDWGTASLNRPLITGDRLLTGEDGRAALELGDAALRINHGSAFNFLDLTDGSAQVELSQGTLNLRVRNLDGEQNYEIDTPAVAFVASQPGTYRVDVAPDGTGTMVTVFDGAGVVYGENGVSRPVTAGRSYRFNDSRLANVDVEGLPAADDFDRFCSERDTRYMDSPSRRYVSTDVIGYDDLDDYGDWQPTPDYGEVWTPTHVAAGWAPYRNGHWAWIDPWGWTWVDNEPWGFAPFHYGRWAYVRSRWCWVPGPRVRHTVYAPALVAFVGGSGLSLSINIGGHRRYGHPVGWFPLGPRDVYRPPYRVSRRYFNNVNITNVRMANRTVINNYYNGYAANPRTLPRGAYMYRNNPRAFTVVPREVFTGARSVSPAVLHVRPDALGRATVGSTPHVAPGVASLGIRADARNRLATNARKPFARAVIARHAPPPPSVPFANREKLIAKQGGAPLPVAQLRQLRQQRARTGRTPQRVRVVAAAAGSNMPNPRAAPNVPNRPRIEPAPRALPNGVRPPIAAHRSNAAPTPATTPHQPPARAGELRSARFAQPQATGTLPQPPHIRPANEPAPRRMAEKPNAASEHAAPQPPVVPQRANRENGFVQAPRAPLQHPARSVPAGMPDRMNTDRTAQLHAQQEQQHAAGMSQARDMQNRQAEQRASQARAQQQRAQQEQQRASQMRAQQEQQRASFDQRQRTQPMRMPQQRAMPTRQAAPTPHAPPSQREPQKKHKNAKDQHDGGH